MSLILPPSVQKLQTVLHAKAKGSSGCLPWLTANLPWANA